MLNNIHAGGISKNGNVTVLHHSGATSEILIDDVHSSIKRKPDILICHIGTNDLSKNIDPMPHLQTIVDRVKEKSATTKIPFSSLFVRKNRVDMEKNMEKLNMAIRKFCLENLIDYSNSRNVNESCLGQGKLYPNKKGNQFSLLI